MIGYLDLNVEHPINTNLEYLPVTNGSSVRIYWKNSGRIPLEFLFGNNHNGYIGGIEYSSSPNAKPTANQIYNHLANINKSIFNKISNIALTDFDIEIQT
jgi:hypothetical protein